MGKRDGLAKALAIIGVVLLFLPIALPLVFGLGSIGRPGGIRIDYLMPFEVYPITLVGLALVLWASLRAKLRRRGVGISIGVMFAGLVLASVSAQVTGIANSVEQLEAWRYALTAGLAVVSILGQIALAVIAVLLIRDLFAPGAAVANSAAAPAPETPSEL